MAVDWIKVWIRRTKLGRQGFSNEERDEIIDKEKRQGKFDVGI